GGGDAKLWLLRLGLDIMAGPTSADISAVLLRLSPIFFLPIILTKFMFTCCNGGIEGVVPQLGFVARS
ncbi:hypothetical protein FCV25MIE_33112, partial [Fagus crenata]